MAPQPAWIPYGFTMENINVIEIIERTGSALSILSFLIIAFTYWLCPSLRASTFNRTIFFASWGNMGSNIATMISVSGPRSGNHSAMCKIQGFLIQWFMPADALWAFCMALNVFFVFQTSNLRYRAREFDTLYIIVCYGIPLIPALVYLVLDLTLFKELEPFYGDATLWCWISKDHQILRITTFYGPVWIVIGLIGGFYTWTGLHLDRTHVRNTKFQHEMNYGQRSNKSVDSFPSGAESSTSSRVITKETEFTQTSELRSQSHDNVNIAAIAPPSPVLHSTSPLLNYPAPFGPDAHAPLPFPSTAYPSSPSPRGFRTRVSQVTTSISTPRKKYRQSSSTNKHARIYALVAFMVFLALIIVWVPATINRIWGLVKKPGKGSQVGNSVPMNYMSALVLPLQGFFNCVIYCFFSRKNLYMEFHKMIHHIRGTPSPPAQHSTFNMSASVIRMRSHEVISRQAEQDLDPAFDDLDEITVADDDTTFMAALERASRMEYPGQSAGYKKSPV